jgi:hypothetical protein
VLPRPVTIGLARADDVGRGHAAGQELLNRETSQVA